jgi:hypothetical protein
MPRAIVAIGGGEIRTQGRRLTGDYSTLRQKESEASFIRSASSDSERYWKQVQEYFGGFLKCKTDVLYRIKEQPSSEQIRSRCLAADII